MNGRHFAGSKVEAYIYDGQEKFRKKRTKDAESEENLRLDKFGSWLEAGGE